MRCNYFSVSDIAKQYNFSYRTIWNYIKEKKLKAVKVNGTLRISKAEFKKLIKED